MSEDFTDPSRPTPLHHAMQHRWPADHIGHAAVQRLLDAEPADEHEQPDGAGFVWAALLGVGIALGGVLLVWLVRML